MEPSGDEPTYFTAYEAAALIGRRYRATCAYSGVPAGTVGTVSGVYPAGGGGAFYGIDITWENIPCSSPLGQRRGGLTDGFSREDLFAVFTAGASIGCRAMVPLDGADGGPWPLDDWGLVLGATSSHAGT